jgi:hypothetical protein
VRSVKKSCVHIVHPKDGRLIPFDTYNLFYRDDLGADAPRAAARQQDAWPVWSGYELDDPTVLPRHGAGAAARRCRRSPRRRSAAVVSRWSSGAWAYGRSSAARARRRRRHPAAHVLLESRAQVLDAQLSLYAANFGNAAQHLEYAEAAAGRGLERDARGDQDELATKVDAALQQVMTGRDLAAKLSLDANSKAGEASKLLAEVLSACLADRPTSGSSPSPATVYSRPVSPSAPASPRRLAALEHDA